MSTSGFDWQPRHVSIEKVLVRGRAATRSLRASVGLRTWARAEPWNPKSKPLRSLLGRDGEPAARTPRAPWRRSRSGKAAAIRGVVLVVLVVVVLNGCMGGKPEAEAADVRFEQIDHVAAASTSVSRPGLPINTNYFSQITVAKGLSDADLALVIDQVLVIAREELGPTASGDAGLFFRTDDGSIDLKEVVPRLGDLGLQGSNLSMGTITLTRGELKAYVSPSEVS